MLLSLYLDDGGKRLFKVELAELEALHIQTIVQLAVCWVQFLDGWVAKDLGNRGKA